MFATERLSAVLAALSLVAAAPAAVALVQSGPVAAGSGASAPTVVYRESKGTVDLSPIVVNGEHLPFPIALQMIKTALTRPWSSAQADRDQMVCRFVDMMASHLQTLRCETNAQHQRLAQATQMAFFEAGAAEVHGGCNLYCVIANGKVAFPVVEYVDQHQINAGALRTVLRKLPPPDSNYTLEVTEQGKAVLAYVVRNGRLVKVYTLKSALTKSGGD